MWKLTALCLVCACITICNAEEIFKGGVKFTSYSLEKSFIDNKIINDVVPSAPANKLKVEYNSGVVVNLGNELTPTQVKDKPTVTWDAENDEMYMLILIDPDFPSRYKPIDKEFRHWMVVNIPGNNVSMGSEIVEYVGAIPPPGSDFHRLVFLMFEQPAIIDIEKETYINKGSVGGRTSFSTLSLMAEFELGEPVGGNWFKAKYDEHVSDVYKRFGARKALYNI